MLFVLDENPIGRPAHRHLYRVLFLVPQDDDVAKLGPPHVGNLVGHQILRRLRRRNQRLTAAPLEIRAGPKTIQPEAPSAF